MARRYLKELGDREDIDDVFIASEKQLRPNRNGNLYLQLRLSDRSGSINAMMWNASNSVYLAFDNGDYVQVQGSSQIYNGNLQIIVNQIEEAEPGSINEEDFVHLSSAQREELQQTLGKSLRALEDFHLKSLAECFLMDESFMKKFSRAPAGIKHHHAYPGGLLEHVVHLIRVVDSICPHYPQVDHALLVMGTFLHDIGKIDELTYDKALGYSDEGQMVGHLVQGVTILDRKLQQVSELSGEEFPDALAMQLKHMIVSHHGKLEYGSPKVPMTMEALVLHYLDDLDAKVHNFDQLMRDDPNEDSAWTTYHPHLGRKLFKAP